MAAAMLLPEIDALCSEVDHTELAAAVRGHADALAGLLYWLTILPAPMGTTMAFSLGWSPAHVAGWMPVATERAAEALRLTLAPLALAA